VESETEQPDRSAGRIASNAWRSAVGVASDMPLLILSSFILYAAIRLEIEWAGDHNFIPSLRFHPHDLGDIYSPSRLSVEFVQSVVVAFVMAPAAVATHRYILLNERTAGVVSLRPAHTQLFVYWLVGLQIITYLLMLPGHLLGHWLIAASLFSLALFVPIVFFGIRLALVFPAIAVDAPVRGVVRRLDASWQETRGHFWRLFGASILAVLPAALFYLVIKSIWMGSATQPTTPPQILFESFYGWLVAIVSVAVISWAYQFFGPTSAERTSR
jgi:hypothetical protein